MHHTKYIYLFEEYRNLSAQYQIRNDLHRQCQEVRLDLSRFQFQAENCNKCLGDSLTYFVTVCRKFHYTTTWFSPL